MEITRLGGLVNLTLLDHAGWLELGRVATFIVQVCPGHGWVYFLFCLGNKKPLLCLVTGFSWSIFIRAVIDHMICYNLNWPKIK